MNEANTLTDIETIVRPERKLQHHLQNVEEQLNLLLIDLSQLVTRNLVSMEERNDSCWDEKLEGFRVRATTIRRIMDRFHDADLPTRRYLRHHLDEEWSHLKEAYDSLRDLFTSKEHTPNRAAELMESEGGKKWNG